MSLADDLLDYQSYVKIRETEGRKTLLDPVRKKSIILQPEELVRQIWLWYLHEKYGIPFAAMSVEKMLQTPNSQRRYDLIVYQQGIPHLLFEFKSFKVQLDQDTCMQIAQYNRQLNVPYLVISNGKETMAFEVRKDEAEVVSLPSLPLEQLP